MGTPTEPILASALWTSHLAHTGSHGPSKRYELSTGCQTVDSALDGGLEYGRVHCISGEADSGLRDLLQAFLVSHLLSSPEATATTIDTALSFDVRQIHQALVAAIPTQVHVGRKAMKVLDRLQIMKVFDFVGLTESVSELRDTMEGREPFPNSPEPQQKAPKGTIGDSEDEEEMLDSPSPPSNPLPPRPAVPPQEQAPSHGLLVIDNINQVATPLLRNNYAQGQALLTTFLRSISHLTKAHNLCTILLNGVTSNTNVREEAPSVFSSYMLRLTLGKTFTYMLDTHMLVHQVPRTSAGSKEAYGRSEDRSAQAVGVEWVYVVEMLQDRNGRRLGRWAPFTVENGGRLKDVA